MDLGDNVFCQCTFEGDFVASSLNASRMAATGAQGGYDFSGSTFKRKMVLPNRRFINYAKFNGTTFHQVPNLSGCKFPQKTDFHNVVFKSSPQDGQAMYRELRVKMADLPDRYYEGIFFALEKRCERKKHPLGFERSISCLYDWVSHYGHSYRQAAKIFSLIQILALSGYYVAGAGWASWKLLFSQIVRPFELMSIRLASEQLSWLPDSACLGAISAIGFLHSLLSLILIAMFLLALRWNFRKG